MPKPTLEALLNLQELSGDQRFNRLFPQAINSIQDKFEKSPNNLPQLIEALAVNINTANTVDSARYAMYWSGKYNWPLSRDAAAGMVDFATKELLALLKELKNYYTEQEKPLAAKIINAIQRHLIGQAVQLKLGRIHREKYRGLQDLFETNFTITFEGVDITNEVTRFIENYRPDDNNKWSTYNVYWHMIYKKQIEIGDEVITEVNGVDYTVENLISDIQQKSSEWDIEKMVAVATIAQELGMDYSDWYRTVNGVDIETTEELISFIKDGISSTGDFLFTGTEPAQTPSYLGYLPQYKTGETYRQTTYLSDTLLATIKEHIEKYLGDEIQNLEEYAIVIPGANSNQFYYFGDEPIHFANAEDWASYIENRDNSIPNDEEPYLMLVAEDRPPVIILLQAGREEVDGTESQELTKYSCQAYAMGHHEFGHLWQYLMRIAATEQLEQNLGVSFGEFKTLLVNDQRFSVYALNEVVAVFNELSANDGSSEMIRYFSRRLPHLLGIETARAKTQIQINHKVFQLVSEGKELSDEVKEQIITDAQEAYTQNMQELMGIQAIPGNVFDDFYDQSMFVYSTPYLYGIIIAAGLKQLEASNNITSQKAADVIKHLMTSDLTGEQTQIAKLLENYGYDFEFLAKRAFEYIAKAIQEGKRVEGEA